MKSGVAKWTLGIRRATKTREEEWVGEKGNIRQKTADIRKMLHTKDAIILINHETSSPAGRKQVGCVTLNFCESERQQ